MRDSDRPMTQREAYQRGYAAGYAAAQSGPPREPTPAMFIAGTKALAAADGSFARVVWQAMHDAWKSGYAQAKEESALEQQFCPHCNPCCGDGNDKCRKPAADPIADLARRLRALRIVDEVHSDNPLGRDAADLIERQAREIAAVQTLLHDTEDRLMQMRAENVALRELLRKVLHATSANMSMDMYAEVCAAIDAERAKVAP